MTVTHVTQRGCNIKLLVETLESYCNGSTNDGNVPIWKGSIGLGLDVGADWRG